MSHHSQDVRRGNSIFVRWRPLDQCPEPEDEVKRSYSERDEGGKQLTISSNGFSSWNSANAFTEIFETTASNQDIFDSCVVPVLPKVLQRATCKFFAYRHTGSGKTFTIAGGPHASDDVERQNLGLQLLTVRWLFDRIEDVFRHETSPQSRNDERVGLGLRLFELRRSKAYDLLDGRKECHIRQGADGKTHIRSETEVLHNGRIRVRPITQIACWSFADAACRLQEGLDLRSTGTSTVHDQSSRTHAILEIEVVNQTLLDARDALVEAESSLVPVGKRATDVYMEEMAQSLVRADDGTFTENPLRPVDHARIAAAEAEKKIYSDRVEHAQRTATAALSAPSLIPLGGKAIFADLAGAEFNSSFGAPNAARQQTPQERQEGRQINADLFALKEVMRAWAARQARVPFRSSTLTMVLREHFEADEVAEMAGTFLTVSPAEAQVRATMNTLKYGKVMGMGSL